MRTPTSSNSPTPSAAATDHVGQEAEDADGEGQVVAPALARWRCRGRRRRTRQVDGRSPSAIEHGAEEHAEDGRDVEQEDGDLQGLGLRWVRPAAGTPRQSGRVALRGGCRGRARRRCGHPPATADPVRPKPLCPVGGVPLVDHAIDRVRPAWPARSPSTCTTAASADGAPPRRHRPGSTCRSRRSGRSAPPVRSACSATGSTGGPSSSSTATRGPPCRSRPCSTAGTASGSACSSSGGGRRRRPRLVAALLPWTDVAGLGAACRPASGRWLARRPRRAGRLDRRPGGGRSSTAAPPAPTSRPTCRQRWRARSWRPAAAVERRRRPDGVGRVAGGRRRGRRAPRRRRSATPAGGPSSSGEAPTCDAGRRGRRGAGRTPRRSRRPRVRRTVALTPSSRRRSRNARTRPAGVPRTG